MLGSPQGSHAPLDLPSDLHSICPSDIVAEDGDVTKVSSELRICANCKHLREKALARPFSGSLDAWTPDILEAKNRWEEEQNELALLERQRFEAGDAFDFEPNYYPWCARWTAQEGRSTFDPVTGRTSPIYVLCATGNRDGQCPLYEPGPRGA